MYKVYGNVLSTGTEERTIEVLGGFGHSRMCVCGGERVRHRLWGTCNNRTMVPHKEIQWNNGTPQ